MFEHLRVDLKNGNGLIVFMRSRGWESYAKNTIWKTFGTWTKAIASLNNSQVKGLPKKKKKQSLKEIEAASNCCFFRKYWWWESWQTKRHLEKQKPSMFSWSECQNWIENTATCLKSTMKTPKQFEKSLQS